MEFYGIQLGATEGMPFGAIRAPHLPSLHKLLNEEGETPVGLEVLGTMARAPVGLAEADEPEPGCAGPDRKPRELPGGIPGGIPVRDDQVKYQVKTQVDHANRHHVKNQVKNQGFLRTRKPGEIPGEIPG